MTIKNAKNATKNATKNTIKIHVFDVNVDECFAPMVEHIMSPTAHNEFATMLMVAHPKPVSVADVLAWQMRNPKYLPSTNNAQKRAENNIRSHIQNVNNPQKRVSFADVNMRVVKTVDGYKLIPIES